MFSSVPLAGSLSSMPLEANKQYRLRRRCRPFERIYKPKILASSSTILSP